MLGAWDIPHNMRISENEHIVYIIVCISIIDVYIYIYIYISYIYICSPPPTTPFFNGSTCNTIQYMTFVYVVNMLRGGALDAADDHANPVGIESLF